MCYIKIYSIKVLNEIKESFKIFLSVQKKNKNLNIYHISLLKGLFDILFVKQSNRQVSTGSEFAKLILFPSKMMDKISLYLRMLILIKENLYKFQLRDLFIWVLEIVPVASNIKKTINKTKTAYERKENICKWCNWQRIKVQNIQTIHTTQS